MYPSTIRYIIKQILGCKKWGSHWFSKFLILTVFLLWLPWLCFSILDLSLDCQNAVIAMVMEGILATCLPPCGFKKNEVKIWLANTPLVPLVKITCFIKIFWTFLWWQRKTTRWFFLLHCYHKVPEKRNIFCTYNPHTLMYLFYRE